MLLDSDNISRPSMKSPYCPQSFLVCIPTAFGTPCFCVLVTMEQVTVEELRGGMVVSGPHVQLAECMRLFAGGVIMAALRKTDWWTGGVVEYRTLCMMRDTMSRGSAR